MHRASCHFLESCNIILDEGGATPHYEHIILETDNAGDPPPLPTSSPTTSCTTPAPTNSTKPTTPPSTNVTSRPKRTIHTPTCNDDNRYCKGSVCAGPAQAHFPFVRPLADRSNDACPSAHFFTCSASTIIPPPPPHPLSRHIFLI